MNRVLMLLTNAFMPDPRPYQEARSLVKAGNSVRVLCWDRGEGLPRADLSDGIAIERIRLASTHGRGTLQAFFLCILWMKMLKRGLRERPDIIYCHDFDTLPAGIMLKAIGGGKLVFDSHEVYSRMLGRNVPGIIKAAVVLSEKILIKKVDWIIVTCPAMEELYRSFGAGNISLIGNWKDPHDFAIPEDALCEKRRLYGIKNELVVTYIANLGPERIIAPLLEAVAEDREVFLIIGGDGLQSDIAQEAGRRSSNIRYLGYVPPKNVPLYTRLSDVIYYGYRRDCGMAEYNSPNKLFEALASGRAFLGGDFGEMGRIVREEKCGIALADITKESLKAALAALKNRGALEAYKYNALKAAEKRYNWMMAEKELLNIIDRITSDNS